MRSTNICKVLRRYRTQLLLLCAGYILLHHLIFSGNCGLPPYPGCDHEFFKPRSTPQFSLDYAYIHDARNACSGLGKQDSGSLTGPDVIILVLTMSKNVEERQAVRDTYGRVAKGEAWPRPGATANEEVFRTVRESETISGAVGIGERSRNIIVQNSDALGENSETFGEVSGIFSQNRRKMVDDRNTLLKTKADIEHGEHFRTVRESGILDNEHLAESNKRFGEYSEDFRQDNEKPGDIDVLGETKVGTVRVVFLMGQTTDLNYRPTEGQILREESLLYGDIVQWDGLEETYFNLTLKVLLGFRWVRHYCPHAQHVVKADESTFIHLPRLFKHIEETKEQLNKLVALGVDSSARLPHQIHGGLHYDVIPVSRTGKFAVSETAYPFCIYPAYVDGPFYFMHISLAMRILSVANYLPYMNIEDAHITGVSACAVRARHYGLGLGEYYPCQNGRRCDFNQYGSVMAARDIVPETFKEIWAAFYNPSLCSKVEIVYLRTLDLLRQAICNIMMNS